MPWRTQSELNDFLLDGSGIDQRGAGAGRLHVSFDYTQGDFARQVFRTPTGKLELYSERMKAAGLDPLPDYKAPDALAGLCDDYPLLLQTGQREKTYHHSRFRDQAWAQKVSPDPLVHLSPATAERFGVSEGHWVMVEVADGPGRCRLKAHVTTTTPDGVLVTGMGWWRPSSPGPTFDALDININAALGYGGPYDPASGSPDTRMLPCRVTVLQEA